MAEVRGFRGLRFVAERVGTLDDVITPPYDVIDPEQRRDLTARRPYNMAHLLLPQDAPGLNRYERAARDFDAWLADGVLRQDTEDSIYLLEQAFVGIEGDSYVRRGFFAVIRLPEPGEEIILGHERTFTAPFEDRLRLTQATRANLGPTLALYSDPDGVVRRIIEPHFSRQPDAGVAHSIDGVTQRVWPVPYDARVTDFFRDKKLYIADGHHRFATACAYRDAMRNNTATPDVGPHDFVLMGLVPFDDPGLLIYPPHRLLDHQDAFEVSAFLDALDQWFEVTPVAKDLAGKVNAAEGCTIGVAIHSHGHYLLTLRDIDRVTLLGDDRGPAWRGLDVAVLHRGIIEQLLGLDETTQFTYERIAVRAVEAVDRGEKSLAFILRPVLSEQLRACAEAQEPMPPKSTYFFPKLPSGAVIHRLI